MLYNMFIFILITHLSNPNIPFNNILYDAYNIYVKPYNNQIIQEEQTNEIQTIAGDAGILTIKNANIEVGLYTDADSFQDYDKASIQYYNQYGICWIADHVNQDNFKNLKNISIGSDVYINDAHYIVQENIYYYDFYSNFQGCGFLEKMNYYYSINGLAIQTCEGNGARIVYCSKQ